MAHLDHRVISNGKGRFIPDFGSSACRKLYVRSHPLAVTYITF